MPANKKTAEILIYDPIGDSYWGGVSAKSIIDQIEAAGEAEQITVRLNTPGGDVFEGAAIYNALARADAHIIMEVDGLAASAGALIAMAGDEIRIADNAFFMVHNSIGFTYGNKETHDKMRDLLNQIDGSIAGVFVNRTGNTRAEIIEMMTAETWLNADKAVELGFADSIWKKPASATPENKFNTGIANHYANIPAGVREQYFAENSAKHDRTLRVAAMAKGVRPDAELIVANLLGKGKSMSEKPNAPENPAPPATPANNAPPVTPAPANPAPAPSADAIAKAQADAIAKAQADAIAKAQADAATAENARVTEILALCNTAGVSDKAAGFIADRTVTVANVKDQIFQILAAKNAVAPATPEPAKPDPDAGLKSEYAKDKAHYDAAGLTEDEVIRSMKITDNGGFLPMPQQHRRKPDTAAK